MHHLAYDGNLVVSKMECRLMFSATLRAAAEEYRRVPRNGRQGCETDANLSQCALERCETLARLFREPLVQNTPGIRRFVRSEYST